MSAQYLDLNTIGLVNMSIDGSVISKEEMEEHRLLCSFPGSCRVFKEKLTDPYQVPPKIYVSFKKEHYVYKEDFVAYLQFMTSNLSMQPEEKDLFLSFIAFFLKTKEQRLEGSFELVPFPVEDLLKLCKKLSNKCDNIFYTPRSNKYKLSSYTMKYVFGRFKKILPVNNNDPEYATILEVLENYASGIPVQDNVFLYEGILEWTSIVVKEFTKFINARPYLFNPNPNYFKTKKIIRVFQDDNELFVFCLEYDLLKHEKLNLDDELVKHQRFSTIKFLDLGRCGMDLSNFEFVIVPILRTKTEAAYIPLAKGKYAILASDNLLEILRVMITFQRAFQKIDFQYVSDQFQQLKHHFCSPLDQIYVVETETVDLMKQWFFNSIQTIMEPFKDEVKAPRNVEFTLENLKEELKFLKVAGTFPEIFEHAERVFNKMTSGKTPEELKTCDMDDAVEMCQLVCVLNRLPYLHKFLHTQRACKRVMMDCPDCAKTHEFLSEAARKEGLTLERCIELIKERIDAHCANYK